MESSAAALTRIRKRIAIGKLPSTHAKRLYIGPGEGLACDGCSRVIGDDVLEYQFEAPLAEPRRLLRFHHECFRLWESETEAGAAR